jgi:maleate cis-trans isomerase
VSVLAKRLRILPTLPWNLPADGWLVRVLAIEGRFAFGIYRRQMRAIGYLTQLEKQMGMPVTTRNWNTICTVVKTLNADRD